jgi:hypothetical protein
MNSPLKMIGKYAYLVMLILALMTGCAPGPKVVPEPEPEPVEPPPLSAGFEPKSFHHSMKEEMRKSYDHANEILIGELTGTHQNEESGLIYYVSDFSFFDKQTLTWGESQNVIMKVQQNGIKPEIIWREEFKGLIDLDKVGICWDFYEGSRNVFLVEGRINLIFLEAGFDESTGDAFRHLIDTYPDTNECRAKDVFNMMIQDLVLEKAKSHSR